MSSFEEVPDSDQSSNYKIGQGKLTKELLAQGLLTPKMLQTLQSEWEQSKSSSKQSIRRSSKICTRRNKK